MILDDFHDGTTFFNMIPNGQLKQLLLEHFRKVDHLIQRLEADVWFWIASLMGQHFST